MKYNMKSEEKVQAENIFCRKNPVWNIILHFGGNFQKVLDLE